VSLIYAKAQGSSGLHTLGEEKVRTRGRSIAEQVDSFQINTKFTVHTNTGGRGLLRYSWAIRFLINRILKEKAITDVEKVKFGVCCS
jgi:hypothetical protein